MLAGKLELLTAVVRDPLAGVGVEPDAQLGAGGNCIKIGLPGKSILGYYFQSNGTYPKTFSLTENQFSGKTYFYTIHPWS